MEDQTTNPPVAAEPELSRITAIRCFLALACSHAVAAYAAARVTIRYMLDGAAEVPFAVLAIASIGLGAFLAFRRMVDQPFGRRMLYGTTLIALWFLMSFVQLNIAADSMISRPLLTILWGIGTIWIAWSVWAWSFFRAKGVVLGSLLAGLGAVICWSQIAVTGLTGDAAVEIAWRKPAFSPADTLNQSSGLAESAEVIWPGYLGTDRSGRLDSVQLNEDWVNNPPKELWRVNCGEGWSSFAATDTTLFTQEQLDRKDCVTARSRTTGEIIWFAAESTEGFRSGLGGDGPRATPTLGMLPDTDTQRLVVYSIGPAGLLRCLDAADGNEIWSVDVLSEFPGENLVHAVCGSPLLINDMVVVCPPGDSGPCLAAFSAVDGQKIWKCDSDWRASYASPSAVTIHGREQIVVHAGKGVVAVDPADGKTIWQFEWSNEWDNNATQPLQLAESENELIIATGYRGGAVRLAFDSDDAGGLTAREVWKTTRTLRTKFCGVAQFGDTLVGLDNGILCGADIETGKQKWKGGRYGHGQMLQVGDHLLVIAEKGRLHLLKPNATGHNELCAVEALDRKTWNHPVLLNDQLIIRNDQEIVCFKIPATLSIDVGKE